MPPRVTRSSARAAAEQPPHEQPASVESDDEAPEEVSLATAKAAHEEERSTRKQAVKPTPRKRGKGSAAAEPEHQQPQAEQQPAHETEEQPAAQPKPTGQKKRFADDDLLPEDILQQLDDRPDALVVQTGQKESTAHTQHTADNKHQRKKQKLHTKQKGPVTVAVLSAVTKLAPGTTSSFLRDQLYSGRLKRSADMLRQQAATLANGVLGPAARFV